MAKSWFLKIIKNYHSLFLQILVIFFVLFIFHYFSFHYYIFEEAKKLENVVLRRTFASGLLWIALLFGILSIQKESIKKIGVRIFAGLFMLFSLFVLVDGIILYFSGLHLTPTAVSHREGARSLVADVFLHAPMAGLFCAVILAIGILLFYIKKLYSLSVSPLFTIAAVLFAGLFFITDTLWFTMPERLVYKSFTQHKAEEVILPEALFKKLERFGIAYDQEQFSLVNKPEVFSSSTSFRTDSKKPNIIIIFLESFSTRLTSLKYNQFPGLTPNLERMANNSNTVQFTNLYNASTPTATGLLSLLCSHYPTTSHLEIETRGSLSGHRLQCLPEFLKDHGGFGTARYITAVEKTYANKKGMFTDMGVDDVWGTTELKKIISEKPTSWGFSDHQIFPEILPLAQELEKEEEPFLLMYSTVDSHPPYGFPNDGVRYEDGQENVLDVFHSTDHAFGEFWDVFIQSELASTTMVVAIADHAAFPNQPLKEVFDSVEPGQYYDQIVFQVYDPRGVAKSLITTKASGVDVTPTLLQLLNVSAGHSFEGLSIFDQREDAPNILGMNDLGIYIYEEGEQPLYAVPDLLECEHDILKQVQSEEPLTLCELKAFYQWKRAQFVKGRFWKKVN